MKGEPLLAERYERVRLRVLKGGVGDNDGLVMMRRHGLSAWIAATRAESATRPSISLPHREPGVEIESSTRIQIVSLCADLLLNSFSKGRLS